MAERPGPLGAGGVLVDAIEHAGIAQVPVGRREAPVDLVGAERASIGQERRANAARTRPSRVHHLVEDARQAADSPPAARRVVGPLVAALSTSGAAMVAYRA